MPTAPLLRPHPWVLTLCCVTWEVIPSSTGVGTQLQVPPKNLWMRGWILVLFPLAVCAEPPAFQRVRRDKVQHCEPQACPPPHTPCGNPNRCQKQIKTEESKERLKEQQRGIVYVLRPSYDRPAFPVRADKAADRYSKDAGLCISFSSCAMKSEVAKSHTHTPILSALEGPITPELQMLVSPDRQEKESHLKERAWPLLGDIHFVILKATEKEMHQSLAPNGFKRGFFHRDTIHRARSLLAAELESEER